MHSMERLEAKRQFSGRSSNGGLVLASRKFLSVTKSDYHSESLRISSMRFHFLQVTQHDFARSHDVLLDKRHHAGSVPGDAKVQYFLMFVLGADRERLVTPCEPPIAIEIVAGAVDLLEKERPVGARIYDGVEFGG